MEDSSFREKTSVITCDMQGTVQQYAADAAALFGWTEDEVVGKMSVAAFHMPKNVATLVPRLLREAVEKGKFEEEVVLMRKDGSTFRAILTVRPMVRDGRQVGFMGMTRPLEESARPHLREPKRSTVGERSDSTGWARRVYERVDAMDAEGFANFFTEDGRFKFGNAEPAVGRPAIREAVETFFGTIAGLRHDIVEVWEVGDATIIEANVTYTRRDGRLVTVPAVTIYRRTGGLARTGQVYIDLSPLFA